jgi:transposase
LPLVIKAAHMKLSHSRMPFVRVYFRETQELVFDAHDKAFVFYGGVCRRGIYDNMKHEDRGGSDLRRQSAPV